MDGNGRNEGKGEGGAGKSAIVLVIGSLMYYHCAYRNSNLLSLFSDLFIVLLCSLAILGLLFRQINIQVPVDPLEWQISQETANAIVAWFVNTIGAAESVFRVAATGHDKRLFLKVIFSLYVLSAIGRLALGATVAYAGNLTTFSLSLSLSLIIPLSSLNLTFIHIMTGLCLFCLYLFAESSPTVSSALASFLGRRNDTTEEEEEEDEDEDPII
ncbi:hypothetical protein Fmac_025817 [Flemingia macrophylla]|uniref:Reticulon domain-containing protein n=1 Tax=Flemingia macrophylla TaxID=520843 RepID=A0ABD1LDP7_9FABA